MSLQNLTHIHTARNTKRIQENLKWCTIFEVRHVFNRKNFRNHTFVTVTASHFIANGNNSFGRDVNFDHLQHATSQLITTFHTVDDSVTGVDRKFNFFPLFFVDPLKTFDFRFALETCEQVVEPENLSLFGDELRIFIASQWNFIVIGNWLTEDFFHVFDHVGKDFGDPFISFGFSSLQVFIENLLFFIRQTESSREFLSINHDSFDARLDFERIVFHIFTSPTKNRVQQFFFRSQFRFRFW